MGCFLFVLSAMGSSSRKNKSKDQKKKKVVESESESEEVEVPEQEEVENSSDEESEEEASVGQKRKFQQKDNGDAKKTKQVTTMFVGNLPWSASEDEIREFFGDIDISDLRMMTDRQTGNFKGFCYVDFPDEETAKKAFALSGSDYNGREIEVDYTQAAATNNSAYNNTQGEKSLTCYVGNLSYNTDEDSIRDFFSEAGSITSVRMITDRDTGASKGFCYVEFEDQETADAALSYHGNELDGRNIRVTYTPTSLIEEVVVVAVVSVIAVVAEAVDSVIEAAVVVVSVIEAAVVSVVEVVVEVVVEAEIEAAVVSVAEAEVVDLVIAEVVDLVIVEVVEVVEPLHSLESA